VDLGTASVYATGTFTTILPQPITGRLEGEISSKGPQFSMLGSIPVKNLAFYGRLGLFMARTELTANVSTNVGSGSDSRSASTTAIIFGAGVGYTFLDHFYVNVDYTQYPKLGDEEETGERDVSALMLGFAYRF
jgi:opacity protein-like surface antigen